MIMQNMYSNQQRYLINYDTAKIGNFCACFTNGTWQRARIIDIVGISGSSMTINVILIDYGTFESTTIEKYFTI